MMNLIGEIAQYAIETDQIIKELARQRDQANQQIEGLRNEIVALNRRITEGKAANERLVTELHAVRNPDNGKPPLTVVES